MIKHHGDNIVAFVTKSDSDKSVEVLLHDNARHHMAKNHSTLAEICGISGPMAPKEIRSNDLDSPWASDHLYIGCNFNFGNNAMQAKPDGVNCCNFCHVLRCV